MNVRRASTDDLEDLQALLIRADLPTADLSLELGPFLVAEADGAIAGCAGLEQHGDVGLLRSVAAAPRWRGQGIAVRLCCEMLQVARSLGVQHVYLLTATAPGFFEKIGFSRLSRAAAPDSIRATREFRELCPDTAVLMRRAVPTDATARLVPRLRDAYAAFLRRDPAGLLALLADATVCHLPGSHLGGGRLEGRDAIVRRLVAAATACDAPPEVELLEAFGDDTVVVTAERFRVRRGGKSLDQRVHVVWRFENAQCGDIWAHFEDQHACDAFWEGWVE